MINLSIRQGKFPEAWKPQLIMPFHKKKEKNLLQNYRPVSHLVQIGKLAELAVKEQIVEHFTSNNLFHPNHHGGLAHHSTSTALIQLHDLWLSSAENKELSATCLLDQSSAYDLLPHSIFEEKLSLYNFNDNSIKWIMSFLQNRKQIVKIENKYSEPILNGPHGAAQGSVLAGVLHNINCNDFPECHEHENASSVLFVDDDSDNVHTDNEADLHSLLQQEVNNSVRWLSDNRLCTAPDKSKILVIGTNKLKKLRKFNDMKITIEGEEINESQSEKILGVVMNNQMTFKSHIYGDKDNEGLLSQLSKRVGIISKLSKQISPEKLNPFVQGIFYSKLSYCLPLFGNVFGLEVYKDDESRYQNYTIKDNYKIQVLQNKINRILTRSGKRTSTKELLNMTKSLSVQQMIAYQTLVMTYKILQTTKPVYISNKISQNENMTNLRNKRKTLNVPRMKLAQAREGFVNRAAVLYNKLDEGTRNSETITVFKRQTRQWVLKNILVKPQKGYR